MVDDRPGEQVEHDAPADHRELQERDERELAPQVGRRGAQPGPHAPVQPTGRRGQHPERGEHRELGEAAVEPVGDDEHRQPQQREDRPVVLVGPPVGDDPLEAHGPGRDGEIPVEERAGLGVEEAPEQARSRS